MTPKKQSVAAILMVLALTGFHAKAFSESNVVFMENLYKVADSRPFNAKIFAAFFADDFKDHNPNPQGPKNISHKDAVVGLYTSLASGAPDSKHDLQVVEALGKDNVVIYWKHHGSHTGDLLGIPASGNSFNIAGIEIWTIKNGKVTELRHVEEIATLLTQLGVK